MKFKVEVVVPIYAENAEEAMDMARAELRSRGLYGVHVKGATVAEDDPSRLRATAQFRRAVIPRVDAE